MAMSRVLNKKHWPHQITLPVRHEGNVDPRERWLAENMHEGYPNRWKIIGYHKLTYCFVNQHDATMFALVWSE